MRVAGLILICLLALPAAAEPPAAGRPPVDLELVLAVDVSGSVDSVEAKLQRDGYVAAFRDADVVHAIRSGMVGRIAVLYMEWASAHESRVVIDWEVVSDQATAAAFADRLAAQPILRGRRTSIAAAITSALPRFGARYEARAGSSTCPATAPTTTGRRSYRPATWPSPPASSSTGCPSSTIASSPGACPA